MERSFHRFVTIHALDRQTDRQTDTFLIASPRWHFMQVGKNGSKYDDESLPKLRYVCEIRVKSPSTKLGSEVMRFSSSEVV